MQTNFVTYNCRGLRTPGKCRRLFEFLKISNYDVALIQETHLYSESENKHWATLWPGQCFWSNGFAMSRGVAVLVKPHVDFIVEFFHRDTDGRLIVLDAKISGAKCRLLNVYCSNDVIDRENFLESLAVWLNTSRTLIVGGDFNFVDNKQQDRQGGKARNGGEGSDTWRKVRECGNIFDPFRRFNRNKIVTTWTSGDGKVSCRLDRFYISARLIPSVTAASVAPSTDSDHSFATLSVILNSNMSIGPGYWKCNVKTLDDPNFIEDIEALWTRLSKESVKNIEWWERCKADFKRLIIHHSCRLANNRSGTLHSLYEKLRNLSTLRPATADILSEITELKREINDLLDDKIEGAKVRAKVEYLENEEKPTRAFLQKAKSRAEKTHLNELQVAGRKITETPQLVDACHAFYQDLYTAEPINPSHVDYFLKSLPQLRAGRADLCEGPLTVQECHEAIKGMKAFKTPGSDGLPKEFYERFFRLFGGDFVHVINQACEDGLLSPSQRLGYITLLCKDKTHADQLSNWRPVSLLNVDYKIVSKSLSNRLRKVLGDVVQCDQTCSIPGRSAQDNIHLLRNAYEYCSDTQSSGIFVSYDQAKAFDRVSQDYLTRVLTAFGFGDNFKRWIKLLYTDIYSRVLVNGYLSDFIRILRSLRQGCGLSALLYVLCIEPLANCIRLSPDICGIALPGRAEQLRISLFADDTTTISPDIASVNRNIEIFDRFGAASGATLNKAKCAALIISGSVDMSDWPSWLPVKNRVKICGVIFGADMISANENAVFAKFSKAIEYHKSRALTLRGRVTVLNVCVCSQLWYVGACVLFSNALITRVNKLLFSFISQARWVNRLTLVLPPSEGGLGIFDVTSRLAAYRVNHLRQLIIGSQAKWQIYAAFWVGLQLRDLKPELASNSLPHSKWQPTFYHRAVADLRKICSKQPNSVDPLTLQVKTAYTKLVQQCSRTPLCIAAEPQVDFSRTWQLLESAGIDPRPRDVMWRLAHRTLAVRYLLARFGITRKAPICPLCKTTTVETTEHLFVDCLNVQPLLQCVKICSFLVTGTPLLLDSSAVRYLNFPTCCVRSRDNSVARIISEAVYAIWIIRNSAARDRRASARPQDIKSLFLFRMRGRLKADFRRLSAAEFADQWRGLAAIRHGTLVINLPV